jgi:hypothetical protein
MLNSVPSPLALDHRRISDLAVMRALIVQLCDKERKEGEKGRESHNFTSTHECGQEFHSI